MRGYGSTTGNKGNTHSAIDVQIMGAGTFFDFAIRINMRDSIPMLRANLYVSPTNSITNKNSVPPISMNSFFLLLFANTGVNVIILAVANHTDITAKDA